MPDFALTSEQELLRNAARDFVQRECPLSELRRMDREGIEFSRELWDKMAALGWPGILVSKQYGGEGASLTDAAVLFEELGRGLLPSPLLSTIMCALLIDRAGVDGQRAELLPAIARGERVVALACTEDNYGWSADHVHATATRRGDAYVIDGTKRFVADAGSADMLVVAARTNETGLTLLLVDKSAAGVEVRPVRAWAGETLYDVSLREVANSPENVLGEIDRGWDALTPVLDIATALLCAYIAGAARRVYEISLGYAQRREQFGQPIARFQRVQDHLIDILNHADAARWTAYHAIWQLEQDAPGAEEAVSVAKAAASDGFYQLCDAAHHVHGGIGSEKGYGLYLYTKASRSLYHYLGSPAHHRRRIARLLRL
ncbi:MAG: acyl-CoA dehydrogenase family protein [Dehalococcoidia bacterium]